MKIRESSMPEEAYWETLFDVPLILDRLTFFPQMRDVVELGCGYGTFTIPVARRIAGVLTTTDIDPVMVERTRQRTEEAGLSNVICRQRDVMIDGFGVPPASQDVCLLFNILHGEGPVRLLAEAARILRAGGHVLVIHWRYDRATPRGPDLAIRPRSEQIIAWAGRTGALSLDGPVLDLPPWHYGLRLQRMSDVSESA